VSAPSAPETRSDGAPIVLDDGREQMVRVEGLKKHYPIREGVLRRQTGAVKAVDGISFSIPTGETLGLVGESGCGKTTAGKSVLRIREPTAGTVEIDGRDVTALSSSELKSFRRNMQMVYQDPTSSLNPRRKIGSIITEPMKIHDVGDEASRRERAEELLDLVGLPAADFVDRYPSALSGGQKQRVGIARAVSLNPKFVVLDEPTSALDVSVQARIVDLLEDLQDRLELTYLFISHDLALVRNVADWIGIMYLGRIVEIGRAERVFRHPRHPYTRALLSAIPVVSDEDETLKPPEIVLEGEIPDPRNQPSGCSFRTRCPEAFDGCANRDPPLYRVGDQHFARCLLHDDEDAAAATATPDWIHE